jgi:hypothetical protein
VRKLWVRLGFHLLTISRYENVTQCQEVPPPPPASTISSVVEAPACRSFGALKVIERALGRQQNGLRGPFPTSFQEQQAFRRTADMSDPYHVAVMQHLVLTHKPQHTFSCFKKRDGKCRFRFPVKQADRTTFDVDLVTKVIKTELRRSPWDCYTVSHNLAMFKAQRCNNAVIMISDAGAGFYITSYTTKPQTEPSFRSISSTTTCSPRAPVPPIQVQPLHRGLLFSCQMVAPKDQGRTLINVGVMLQQSGKRS